MPVDDTTALYDEVKAWIAKQQAYQAATNEPAPLTKAQRKALEVLRLPPPPPPEVGDVDYISLLTRYRQAHSEGANVLRWDEEEKPTKVVDGAKGRICRVTISESCGHADAPVESFPAAGHGFKDGECPLFANKKKAKQYAAKCAIEWLIAQSLMPSDLVQVTFPKDDPVPSRVCYSSSPLSSLSSSPSPLSSPSSPPPPSPSPSPSVKPEIEDSEDDLPLLPRRQPKKGTTGAVDFDDDSLPATQRVSALCPLLGLQAPAYRFKKRQSGGVSYHDGIPVFGPDGADLPEDLGCVTNVVGLDNAKQEAARLVLEHLIPLYRRRQRLAEKLSGYPEDP